MNDTAAPRLMIFTGKGGVGKTTCAAATALRLAHSGKRTLVVSTDPAHSLGDCLQLRLGADPTRISERLDAIELDAAREMRNRFAIVGQILVDQMQRHGLSNVLAEEMVAFPGAEELFCLLKIVDIRDSGLYEFVIVDAAPTGNTMRFLNFPAFLAPVQRALKVDQIVNRLTRPIAQMMGGDRPGEAFYAEIFGLFEEVERVRRYMLTADVAFRLVLTPEKLALAETLRAISFLNISGYAVDAVILNKVIPDEVSDPFFANWKETQRAALQSAYANFSPVRILRASLWPNEVLGTAMLSDFAEEVYGTLEPSQRLTDVPLFEVREVPDAIELRLHVPHEDRSEIKLFRRGAGLVAKVGYYERAIELPAALQARTLEGASFDGNRLVVRFT